MFTLHQKQVLFSQLFAKLITFIGYRGYEVKILQVQRTQAEADANAKSGAGISKSLHLLSLAGDLALYKEGAYLEKPEDYQIAGDYWKSLTTSDVTCCWGGDFHNVDADHFSIEHQGVR